MQDLELRVEPRARPKQYTQNDEMSHDRGRMAAASQGFQPKSP